MLKAVGKLTPSKGLTRIAEEFLGEIQKCDLDDMGSIDLLAIFSKYGNYSGYLVNIMVFGGSSPQQIVTNIVVGDGDKLRCQREDILNENVEVVGLAFGDHKSLKKITCIIACTGFKNTRDHDDIENY